MAPILVRGAAKEEEREFVKKLASSPEKLARMVTPRSVYRRRSRLST